MESEQQQTGDQEISPRKLMDERLRQSDGGSTGVPPTHLEDRLTLDHLSLPPTDEELEKLVHLPPSQLPKQFFRDSCKRVFVNRSLRLDRIEWVGFDMDYTLAVYKSPEFEALTYDIAIAHMIDMGYPQSISQLTYNPAYPIRGLFIDSQLGNMLKVDNFGHIIVCYHGRNRTKKKRVYEIYPSGKVRNEEIGGRYYPVSTLFALPEACLYADLVDHLEALQTTRRQRRNSFLEQQGDASSLDFDDDELIHAEDMDLSFTNLFQDVRATIDYIHNKGELKAAVVADLPRFVHRDPRIATLLHRLRASGKKIFLLTNSLYDYTNHLLTFLLDGLRPDYPSWKDYFHVMIVGAQKPSFFEKGTTLRKVDLETGALKVGSVKDRFEVGQVYNGGSMTLFNSLAGIQNPSQVLYVGDHIFSDIIVSKKTQGWRNLLVVRELDHEVDVWQESQEKHHRLQTLEFIRAEIFRGLDSEATIPPDLTSLRKHTRKAMRDLDEAFNSFFGSLFRSGSKQSFFSMQVQRYADLYTADYLNLLHYPLFYSFYAGPMYLAHEREIPYEALGGGSPAPLPSSK